MSDLDGIEGLEGLISELPQEPADVFLGTHYSTLCLKGDMKSSIQFLRSRYWGPTLIAESNLIVVNLAYAEVREGETESCAALLAGLSSEAAQAGKVVNFISTLAPLRDLMLVSLKDPTAFHDNLLQLLKKYTPAAVDLGPELKLLSNAVIEVFEKQFGIAATVLSTKLFDSDSTESPESEEGWDVIGLLPIVSTGASGNLQLRFQKTTLMELAKLAFGKELSKDDPEVAAIAAELVNMVQGCAKAELNQRGYGIEQALPQTFVGSSKPLKNTLPRPYWSVEFETIYGHVGLGVQIRVN